MLQTKHIQEVIPELKTNDIIIERVQTFDFLGEILYEHTFLKPHIDILANTLIKFSGILNKLKWF